MHYTALGAGADNPMGSISSFYTILVILYMYVAMGQAQIIPLVSNFDQYNHIIKCKFQKKLFNPWFYIDFIHILCII